MNRNQEKELDRLLDSALAHYSAAEPRPGLEERVMAVVHAVPAASRPWFRWVFGAAATAAVLVLALALAHRSSTPKIAVTPPPPPVSAAPAPQPAPRVSGAPPVATAQHRRATSAAQPRRQPALLAAAPLSQQERFLIAYARNTPLPVVLQPERARAPAVPLESAPVTISPVEVPPLENDK